MSFGAATGLAQSSVDLSWDASPSGSVMGYWVHYGVASRAYTNALDAGDITAATIPDLVQGTTYYFAVTAYDGLGLESAFSQEISYRVPLPTEAWLRIQLTPDGGVMLTAIGPPGYHYDLQATDDLINWRTLDTLTVGPKGKSEFTDPTAPRSPSRVYRLVQVEL